MICEPPVDPADPRWLLSALADGEADAAAAERGCAAWAEEGSAARRTWHAYHLIGDVLRSDDLASPPTHDLAFLDRLRARLVDEPAILAPQPLPSAVVAPAAARRRPAWVLPLAMAASLMALATAVVVSLNPSADGQADATRLAAVDATAQPVASVQVAPQGSRIVRDAQLDRYLRAHREYGATLPGSLPGGAGRGVTAVSFDR